MPALAHPDVVLPRLLKLWAAAIAATGLVFWLGLDLRAAGAAAGLAALATFAAASMDGRLGPRRALRGALAITLASFAVATYETGGIHSPELLAFVLVPTLAGLVAGRREAALWGVATLAVAALAAASGDPAAPLVLDPERFRRGVMGCQIGLAALVGVTAYGAYQIGVARERETRAHKEHAETLLRRLTHDVAGPLMVIRGQSYLFSERLGDAAQPFAQRTDAAVRKLDEILRDVRLLVSLSPDRYRPSDEPVDLARVTREAVLDLSPAAKARELALALDLPQEPIRIGAAIDLCRTCLVDVLLTFGAKRSPRGATLAVTLRAADGDAILTVSDRGAALSDEMTAHAFDLGGAHALAAADGEVVSAYALPLAALCAERAGGTVTLASTSGGTTLTARLPLSKR